MSKFKSKIMSKAEFLEDAVYAKEEYEGLLVRADEEKGYYNIGVEIGDDQIVLVDQARDYEVHARVHEWAAQIPDIQRRYGGESFL